MVKQFLVGVTVLMAVALNAEAAVVYTHDFSPADSTFELGSSAGGGEQNLLTIYNSIAGTSLNQWSQLFALAVNPTVYANGNPGGPNPLYSPQGMFNGSSSVAFEARYAGAEHRLYVVDDDGTAINLGLSPISGTYPVSNPSVPLATVTPGSGVFTNVQDPWDLRLDVRRPSTGENWSMSTDYLWNQRVNGTNNNNNAIYALIFRIANDPNKFVIAFEDLLHGDFDYNDVVLTATMLPVPLPSGLGLLAFGLAGVGALKLRRRSTRN